MNGRFFSGTTITIIFNRQSFLSPQSARYHPVFALYQAMERRSWLTEVGRAGVLLFFKYFDW